MYIFNTKRIISGTVYSNRFFSGQGDYTHCLLNYIQQAPIYLLRLYFKPIWPRFGFAEIITNKITNFNCTTLKPGMILLTIRATKGQVPKIFYCLMLKRLTLFHYLNTSNSRNTADPWTTPELGACALPTPQIRV